MLSSTARLALAAGLSIALLATGGCATDDPRAGGFFGGIVGLASGQYGQNLDERERQLEVRRAEQRELEAERERAETEQREVGAALAAHRREAGEVTEELRKLGDKARWLRAGTALVERQRLQVEEEIGAVELELLRRRFRPRAAPTDRAAGS